VDGLPHDALALAALVFVLGLKHGLDPDHLVAIDGLTRFNSQGDRRLARWCGALFSLGHGAVVILVAVAVGLATERWIVPAWVDDLGAWISVTVLVLLGLLNLRAVFATPADHVVRPVGLRGRLFDRLTRTSHPGAITLVGALFALSFDTLSQAALFAVTASQLGGWLPALALGLVFMAGMTLADGANGLWIASLLRSADARARIASRVLGLAVAGLSLGIAAFVVVERHSDAVAAWAEGRELAFGGGVIAVVAVSFVLGLALARRPAVASSAAPRA
jgi:high-affinity nickel-transport protein